MRAGHSTPAIPRSKADAVVREAASRATEEKAAEKDDTGAEVTVVRLGPPLRGARYRCKSIDGEWKVVDRDMPDDAR